MCAQAAGEMGNSRKLGKVLELGTFSKSGEVREVPCLRFHGGCRPSVSRKGGPVLARME
jgi:hypothetical protein